MPLALGEAWGLQHNPHNEQFHPTWAEKKVFFLSGTSSAVLCQRPPYQPHAQEP